MGDTGKAARLFIDRAGDLNGTIERDALGENGF